jgi:hypothetical protein
MKEIDKIILIELELKGTVKQKNNKKKAERLQDNTLMEHAVESAKKHQPTIIKVPTTTYCISGITN